MILYQLLCHKGHDFEAWFRDSGTYDQQVVAGDVACPFCGTSVVTKAPMAPHVATGRGKGGKNRRADILRAAGTLMAAKGYDATSMRDISASVGMLPGSVYYHFPSKEALFVELHKDVVQAMITNCHSGPGAADVRDVQVDRAEAEALEGFEIRR